MAEPSRESLRKLFEFEKKADVVRYCRDLVVSSVDFAELVLECEASGQPFLHQISFKDKVYPDLAPNDPLIEALKNAPTGVLLTGRAAKAVQKMGNMFDQRRLLVGHMFYTLDRSRWHFFWFDQRDLAGQHWGNGSHVHFVNWLWPTFDADSVWSRLVEHDERPGSDLHLRFIEPECKFSGPVEKRSTTELCEGMYDETVDFRFKVTIKGTVRNEVEEMLKLFEKASTDFRETWQRKLEDLK